MIYVNKAGDGNTVSGRLKFTEKSVSIRHE
jgi:hypothetical protein